MAQLLRRTVLRYRWNPERERWEFYGHGRPLWRQSIAFSRDFPPQDCYIVSYESTQHELTELDESPAPYSWWVNPE